ncbi:PQQ-binding-like beta-propeller repeat protein [bacterium]|nr:PQQ-binding-like beta-propeller repeat protein [bacterium]
MKRALWFTGIASMIILMLFLGCGATGRQFKDGMAVMTGRGGRVAHEDLYDKTVEQANILNQDQPSAQWASTFNGEGADIISFLDENRVLVGTVESGAMLGVPGHGDIKLMDTQSGEILWTAGRKGLTNGHYLLILTEPLIILAGRDDDMSCLTAYDPVNGDIKWRYNIKPPDQFLISDAMDKIILFSAQGDGRKVEMLDILTGDLVWSNELTSEVFSPDFPDYLISGHDALYVSGRKIFKLSEKDGTILWSKAYPVLDLKERFVSLTAEGILIYNSNGMSLVNQDNGKVRWNVSGKDYFNVNCTLLDRIVYRVTCGENSTGTVVPGQKIQALKPENGKILWSKPIKGEVVSPICLEQNILVFTTNEGTYGLNSKNGITHFYKAFSNEFILGSPDKAATLKRPDLIRFQFGQLYVAREMAGISAYDFPSGDPLWEQLHFNYANRAYSTDRVYTFIEGTYLGNQADPATVPVLTTTSTSANPFIQSAQRQHEDTRYRTGNVWQSYNSDSDVQNAAPRERIIPLRLQISEMKVSQAMGRMKAAGDLAVSIMNLGAAIQSTYAQTAHKGMIAREYMFLNSVMALPSGAFQGNYYIWPFLDRDRGVTLIDLDTGYRNDLIYSPYLNILDAYGANLPFFTLGPDGKTLVLAGLGLDPEKYEKHTKWNSRFPKSSVLAYDISGFEFNKKSTTQIQAAQRAAQAQAEMAARVQEIQDQDKMHTAAQMGNMELVKSMLDTGIDVDVLNHDKSGTLLVFAVIGGQTEMVRFLLSRGADARFRSTDGKTVFDYAKMFGKKEIISMLKEAGAK